MKMERCGNNKKERKMTTGMKDGEGRVDTVHTSAASDPPNFA